MWNARWSSPCAASSACRPRTCQAAGPCAISLSSSWINNRSSPMSSSRAHSRTLLETLEQASRAGGRRGAGAGAAAAASSSNQNKSGGVSSKQGKSRGRGSAPRDRSPDSRGPGSNSTKSDKDAKGSRKK